MEQPVSQVQHTTCAGGCGTPLGYDGTGRRRRYCSDACKQRAYRRRSTGDVPSNTGAALRNGETSLRNDGQEMLLSAFPLRASIKPIVKYPGAKWRLSHWIVSHFPPHHHYLEPYAGSAACFFVKEPASHEVLNDLNGGLVRLFRVIREQGEELARRIEMTPWAEEEYRECDRLYQESSGDEVEDARRFLVKCWQTHGMKFDVSAGWKHNGLRGRVYPVRLWQALPERLLAVIDRLREAEIRCRPALEMITYYNDPSCLIYADPPYLAETRSGGKLYQYEMTPDDHLALLDALDCHTGAVILSGYPHPLYDERLSHWTRLAAPAIAEYGNKRLEVLWLNTQAVQSQQLSLFPR